ncbi:TVP38/TMEM64 family protein [Shewanella youngdeokensis]|uniref:TVP38/TMEM64 family membrane protein n=1 Tax=Shewanella youngdeokensis TaxID=2999068 RepID=A0ABZ0K0Q5_9GAMM|nr:VTT domain-containing protein [Shewanella sp. DAU334]
MNIKLLLRLLGLAFIIVIVGVALQQGYFQRLSDSQWIVDYVDNHGSAAVSELVLLGVLFSCVGGPRQILAFGFGYALGGVNGALLATCAALISCIVLFYFSRFLIRAHIKRRFEHKLVRLEALLIHKTWLKALMIRLLPLGSNYITNLLAGTTCISPWQFFVGSGIGFLPQMFIFSFAGAGTSLSDARHLQLSGGLLVIAVLIGVYLYRTRLGKQLNQAVKAER